jgi:hypothetical protein
MSAPVAVPVAVSDGFALPTLIFISLSGITIVGHLIYSLRGQPADAKYKITTRFLVLEIMVAFIGTALYYLMCSHGYVAVAWALLILPLIGGIYSITSALIVAWGSEVAAGSTAQSAVLKVATQAATPLPPPNTTTS